MTVSLERPAPIAYRAKYNNCHGGLLYCVPCAARERARDTRDIRGLPVFTWHAVTHGTTRLPYGDRRGCQCANVVYSAVNCEAPPADCEHTLDYALDLPKRWVNVYERTRHYGGPEEGGWWYDRDECIASIPVTSEDSADALVAKYERHFADHAWGNISSVNGGVAVWVAAQYVRAESEDAERPRYA